MYNYQKYLKESKHASQLRKLQRIEREEQTRRQQLAKTLIANHDKRIEHSILTLIEHPQKVNDYHDPAYHPREQDKSKRIVSGEMMYNYEKEPVRIIRNVHRNSSLDLIPFKNSSLYQFRESRIKDKQESRKSLNIGLLGNLGGRDSICSQIREAENKFSRISQNQRASRLPNLQRLPKTYFHTLETIVNKPDTLRITIDEKGNESLSISHKHGSSGGQSRFGLENKEQRERIKEEKLRKCKKALERCGVIPQEGSVQGRMDRHNSLR